jgi:hypothetical protein
LVGRINVIELFFSLFDIVFVDLDIHNEHKCVVVCLLHGRLSSEGELENGMMVTLVSPGGILMRVFGLPPNCTFLGP